MVAPHNLGVLNRTLVKIKNVKSNNGHLDPKILDLSNVSSLAASVPVPPILPAALVRPVTATTTISLTTTLTATAPSKAEAEKLLLLKVTDHCNNYKTLIEKNSLSHLLTLRNKKIKELSRKLRLYKMLLKSNKQTNKQTNTLKSRRVKRLN